MNQISTSNTTTELSTDLPTITAEINAYKRIAGEAIFEIGRRLKHVKENDLVHGEFGKWLRSIDFDESQARRFMKVADELDSKRGTYHDLGLRALYEIATLPPEEREREHTLSSGETKTVDEMTIRELREVKKALREREQALKQAEKLIEQERSRADREQARADRIEQERDRTMQQSAEMYVFERIPHEAEGLGGKDRVLSHVRAFSEDVAELIEKYGYMIYFQRQTESLSDKWREEIMMTVDSLEGFVSSLKKNLTRRTEDGSNIIDIEFEEVM